jgi:hypothetical protein
MKKINNQNSTPNMPGNHRALPSAWGLNIDG